MPQLTLWDSFTKRANSTKRPSAAGWTVNAALKQNTSLSSPTFILAAIPPIPSAVNYAQFEGRFYFVTDIVQQSNHAYELHCTIDPLATYKDAIASYTTFVERSASDFDARINDNALSQRQDIINASTANTTIPGSDATGHYIIRTISGDGIVAYLMTETAMRALIDFLFDDQNYAADIRDNLTKTFFNPFQYIVSCKWVPFTMTPPGVTGESWPFAALTPIKFGWWTSNIAGYRVDGIFKYHLPPIALNMPTKTYSDFRAFNGKYSHYTLYVPGTGLIDVDPLDTEEQLYYQMDIDGMSGASRFLLSHNSGSDIITSIDGVMGVDVQIGQLTASGPVGLALGALASGAAALAGNVLGAASGLVNTVENYLSPTSKIIGSVANMSALSEGTFRFTLDEYGSAAFPQSVAGRPLYQNRQLGTLSGYVKCGNASIDISGFSGERDAVNAALNNGFYME